MQMRLPNSLLLVVLLLPGQIAWCTELPRREGSHQESIKGITSSYGSIETSEGYRLRVIHTRPTGVQGRLPLVYFVQC